MRVVGDGAVKFAQRVVTDRGDAHEMKKRKYGGRGRAENLRGSTVKISVCIAAVELDDTSKVTDRAFKLYPSYLMHTVTARRITWPSLSKEMPRL